MLNKTYSILPKYKSITIPSRQDSLPPTYYPNISTRISSLKK